jgi:hypothetical protein
MSKFEEGQPVWYYEQGMCDPIEYVYVGPWKFITGAPGHEVATKQPYRYVTSHLEGTIYASREDALKAKLLWLKKQEGVLERGLYKIQVAQLQIRDELTKDDRKPGVPSRQDLYKALEKRSEALKGRIDG